MIKILVTGMPTGGTGLLYELPGRKGRRTYVPTYHASAHSLVTGERIDFAVTRDSSALIFSEEPGDRFGEKGECPPCADSPYSGAVREDGVVGFRIEFFEPAYGATRELAGQGSVKRRNMQIHFGAAASFGCLLVAGRRRHFPRVFERPLRSMLAHSDAIEVLVEPRDLT